METNTKSIPPSGVSFVGLQPVVRKTTKWDRTAAIGFSLLFLLSAHSAIAQTTPPRNSETSQPDVVELEEISVTGSHIRMSTTEADKGALPIDEVIARLRDEVAGRK